MRKQTNSRQRGSIYVTVLGVSVLVMVIGMGSILAARVRLKTTNADHDMVQARLYAETCIDLLARRMTQVDWRTNWPNDSWRAWKNLDNGRFRWKVVDEVDGDVTDDIEDPVRVYVRAEVGDAVRLCSAVMQLEPLGAVATNLLTNTGFESGTSDWDVQNGDLETYASDSRSGTASVITKNLLLNSPGPSQDITGKVSNGTTYYLEAFVKMAPGKGPANARITLYGLHLPVITYYHHGFNVAVDDTQWTKVSAILTPIWTDPIDYASFYVDTPGNTEEFLVDDVMLIEGSAPATREMRVVPGTWRQEVQ